MKQFKLFALLVCMFAVGCAPKHSWQTNELAAQLTERNKAAAERNENYLNDPSPRHAKEDRCEVQRKIEERRSTATIAEIARMVKRGYAPAWYYEAETSEGLVAIVDVCDAKKQYILLINGMAHYLDTIGIGDFRHVETGNDQVFLVTRSGMRWRLERGVLIYENSRIEFKVWDPRGS